MDWKGGRRSDNVEDQRNAPLSAGMGGAGGGLLLRLVPFLLGSSAGRMILLVGGLGFVGAKMLGIDVMQLVSGTSGPQSSSVSTPEENELADFVSVVLGSTEDTWSVQFQKMGKNYQKPILVLFTDRVNSACGLAQSAMGPFYCPGDNKLYIDLSFYQDMKTKLGAPGDFAQAYVIAHEVGHHVQNLLGISDKVHEAQQNMSQEDANAISVKLELQADCFSGIWAHFADNESVKIQDGDIEEALNAAAAIGDDKLQKQATGTVRPEKFTHGTSKQRAQWFRTGLEKGSVNDCNTF
jgi:uncharacterized protein